MDKSLMTELSIVIPTYNEIENIAELVDQIFRVFRENHISGELIAVDDNSPDGTGALLDNLKSQYPGLRVVHRSGKLGLSSAVLDGWKIAAGEFLGAMDGDGSHPPELIPKMLSALKLKPADLAISSRYVKGGEIRGWGVYRKAQSWAATVLSRLFTDVRDTMTGFFLVRRSCIENRKINPKGFKILLEIIVRGNCRRIVEIPMIFVNRTRGRSKAGIGEIFGYLYNIAGYIPDAPVLRKTFAKFALVGASGVIVNLIALYALTEYAGLHYLLSATLAFLTAATTNYFLNKTWTFRERLGQTPLLKYLKFLTVSLVALLVNLAVLYALVEYLGIWYMTAAAVGIAVTLVVNFVGNKTWTFDSPKNE